MDIKKNPTTWGQPNTTHYIDPYDPHMDQKERKEKKEEKTKRTNAHMIHIRHAYRTCLLSSSLQNQP